MSRSLTTSILSIAALALVATATPNAEAGCGGGHGRSSGRLSIAYHRNVPHMRSHAPRYHQPAPTYRHAAPVYSQPVQPIVTAPAPQQVAPQPMVVQQAPTTIVQQPALAAPATTGAADQSALAALAAMAGNQPAASPIPQFGPAAQPGTPGHVGAWAATLPGENRVDLQLNADGGFRWVANSRGKVSTFEGTFTIAEGRLVLVRSGDSQQLAGVWVADTNGGFRFKLDGASDNGLLFNRG